MQTGTATQSTPPFAQHEATRKRIREKLLTEIPASYAPFVHLAATTGIGVLLLALGIWGVHHVRLVELLAVPATILFANAFEWRAHKDLMHRLREPFGILYRRHTPQHHAVYVTDDMAIRSSRELKLVLIPAWGVFGIILTLAPFAYGMARFTTVNAGWIVLVTAGLYMVGYELSHLSYHLPPESFIGRLALVRVLRQHHANHHDPRLMHRWNFNVTIPIFDWVHGTIWRQERQEPHVREESASVTSRVESAKAEESEESRAVA